MTVQQMRIQISDAYHTPSWRNKVVNMPDEQVIAIYYRIVRTNQWLLSATNQNTNQSEKPQEDSGHQMTLFECGMKGPYIYEPREA